MTKAMPITTSTVHAHRVVRDLVVVMASFVDVTHHVSPVEPVRSKKTVMMVIRLTVMAVAVRVALRIILPKECH